MHLFTSSFKKTFVLFFLLFIFFGGYKTYCIVEGIIHAHNPGNYFWYKKTFSKNRYDVVLVGDSRVYRGIAPAQISAELQGASVLNFGYSSAGFDSLLMDAAAKKLTVGGRRLLVLGITPHSLTPQAIQNSHYRETCRLTEVSRYEDILEVFLGRETTLDAIARLFRVRASRLNGYIVEHDDGWCECYYPLEPAQGLPVYRKQFATNKVSPEIMRKLFDKVEMFVKNGVVVFGFRPPTYTGMEELENNLSGFTEKDFVRAFEAAGGIWISLDDRFAFACYDGSHLTGDAAKKLSSELGKKMALSLLQQKVSHD